MASHPFTQQILTECLPGTRTANYRGLGGYHSRRSPSPPGVESAFRESDDELELMGYDSREAGSIPRFGTAL